MSPIAPARRTVVYDLLGAQSADHRDRGVARYVKELALAIEALDPTAITTYAVDPELTLPGGIEPLLSSGKVRRRDEVDWSAVDVFHVASAIELSVPIDRVLPRAARRGPAIVTTLYDLIPERLADAYLADPGQRRRYRARTEVIRQADHVLAISAAAAADAAEYLAIPDGRLTVIGAGTNPIFRPPVSRTDAAAAAQVRVPGLAPDFVLYTGGTDHRKNVEGLLAAWARVAPSARARCQLVIVCAVPPLQKNHWEHRASQYGFRDSLLVTGFVEEDDLVLLYQSTRLFVHASLYEGSWLPLAEAMACGAPAIAANVGALPEAVPPEALFDPTDPDAIATAITGALTGCVAASAASAPSWDPVAQRTIEVYQSVQSRYAAPSQLLARESTATAVDSRAKTRGSARMRVALVTPLPPVATGVAEYSQRLAGELAALAELDVFVDAAPHARDAVLEAIAGSAHPARPLASLGRIEALTGPYDRVVYAIGNSEHHTGALAALARRPGIVLAHEVRLTNLYRFAQWQHPDAVPEGFHRALHRLYPDRLPPALGELGLIDEDEVERWGILFARDVISMSERFVTTSGFAADLARLDADAADQYKVIDGDFAIGPAWAERAPNQSNASRAPLIASFGLIHPLKQPDLIVDAFAIVAAQNKAVRLALVGPGAPDQLDALRAQAARLGLAARVTITGAVDPAAYRQWLQDTTVAAQLRSATNGESSAATGDCLAAGCATVVTHLGSARSIPVTAAVPVSPDIAAGDLAELLGRLIQDQPRRVALQSGAAAYADHHTFRDAAVQLYELASSLPLTGASARASS